MKFTVVWLPDAERELARLYLSAARQSEVSAAANAIDRELARGTLDRLTRAMRTLKSGISPNVA